MGAEEPDLSFESLYAMGASAGFAWSSVREAEAKGDFVQQPPRLVGEPARSFQPPVLSGREVTSGGGLQHRAPGGHRWETRGGRSRPGLCAPACDQGGPNRENEKL